MNIIVIGLGSMGRRRIRLIQRYDDRFSILGVDLSDERRKQANSEFGIETISNLSEALKSASFDCAFICTSPLSHSSIINECLKNNLHVFTELNLVSDQYEENTELALENSKVLFLSSTFLHRVEVKHIDKLVKKQEKNLNYTYHIGQYLPDWHPWENYNDFFVGDKRTNGCREIFAIELPWLVEVFGKIDSIGVTKSKMSSLNIDYDDNFLVTIQHESGHKGMLAVDIVSRKAVRNLEIFGEDVYLSWDGSAEGLKEYNIELKREETVQLYHKVEQLEQYSKFVVENAYFEEIVSFFNAVKGLEEPIYDFIKDKEILGIIDRIEA